MSGPFDGGAHLHLLVQGWADRAQGLLDGARQITDVLVPGAICDWMPLGSYKEIRISGAARVAVLRRTMDGHDLQVLSACGKDTMIRESHRDRTELTSLGRRGARERVAYSVADLHRRLEGVDRARGGGFACPSTQEQLGALLGLTPVHVNRVVQALRRDDVQTFGERQAAILDLTLPYAFSGWRSNQADPVPPDRQRFALPRDTDPTPLPSATMNSRGLS
ncbi:Crp/Fnr family transcriptional regulator [uncultured Sphingomonas sp.]|uniref:Crp/Fnr family transcriptional regulator n=1 Tax=uncultured Sphingomonas sp. TaxID=158754 RepID=UPI0026346A18|nr:Crp/Fnr family transcriptional regulator [uncultured Sphingomonas sp.]